MEDRLHSIKLKSNEMINNAQNIKALEDIRIALFGKKGDVTSLMKELSSLPKEERPFFGQKVNVFRNQLESLLEQKNIQLKERDLTKSLLEEELDITMPGKSFLMGHKHPLTTVMDEIKAIFLGMGYKIATGPDIETEYYNFTALNIAKTHPARNEQDTFYIGDYVLRTQTSPVQVRSMEKGELPIKIIAPGRVFRPDEVDATHSPVFHQIEGLVIDKGITMANLKGTLLTFAKELFGRNVNIRFRPHHFPFTEPSAELDITCFICGDEINEVCRVCKGEGYIELLGCGMVHPKVLQMSGIDSNIYSGFAFGMGLERIAMQRYNIEDLRMFYENDIRFLEQF